jgi:lycopene cyclase domain-containing protein
MGNASYLAVMALIFLGAVWLEFGLRTRVFRRWRRLLLSILPVAVLFALWDMYAIASGHWWFDEALITGVRVPGNIPVDEVVFFLLVPIASILTLEAVRSATGLPVGDEAAPGPVSGPEGDAQGSADAAGQRLEEDL